MRPEVDAQFAAALRHPHTAVVRVEAWRGGRRLDGGAGLPVLGGEVKIDATAKVRRQISIDVEASDELWDLLWPVVELRPYRGVRFPDGSVTWVPLGRMEAETQRLGYTASGVLSLSGGDDWSRVQAAEFLTPGTSVLGTPIVDQAVALLAGALPDVEIVNQGVASPWVIGSKVWDTDRAGAIEECLDALGAEVVFDAEGRAVIRPVPSLGSPVWHVDAGQSGVLLSANRDASTQNVRNVVVVTGGGVDGREPITPQIVWDDNPRSPTYAGPDPVNAPRSAGPFGVRVHRHSSGLIQTSEQGFIVATGLLNKVKGLGRRLSLSAAVNPGLEPGDTIAVQLPADRRWGPRPVEHHIVDSVTVPLTVDGAQQIVTRTVGGAGS